MARVDNEGCQEESTRPTINTPNSSSVELAVWMLFVEEPYKAVLYCVYSRRTQERARRLTFLPRFIVRLFRVFVDFVAIGGGGTDTVEKKAKVSRCGYDVINIEGEKTNFMPGIAQEQLDKLIVFVHLSRQ